METAFAPFPRFTAVDTVAPVALWDVEDLHHADLDGVLADRLDDAGVAAASAAATADLVRPDGEAMFAHTLSTRALFLAVL
jgi:hypothetical protein